MQLHMNCCFSAGILTLAKGQKEDDLEAFAPGRLEIYTLSRLTAPFLRSSRETSLFCLLTMSFAAFRVHKTGPERDVAQED